MELVMGVPVAKTTPLLPRSPLRYSVLTSRSKDLAAGVTVIPATFWVLVITQQFL